MLLVIPHVSHFGFLVWIIWFHKIFITVSKLRNQALQGKREEITHSQSGARDSRRGSLVCGIIRVLEAPDLIFLINNLCVETCPRAGKHPNLCENWEKSFHQIVSFEMFLVVFQCRRVKGTVGFVLIQLLNTEGPVSCQGGRNTWWGCAGH